MWYFLRWQTLCTYRCILNHLWTLEETFLKLKFSPLYSNVSFTIVLGTAEWHLNLAHTKHIRMHYQPAFRSVSSTYSIQWYCKTHCFDCNPNTGNFKMRSKLAHYTKTRHPGKQDLRANAMCNMAVTFLSQGALCIFFLLFVTKYSISSCGLFEKWSLVMCSKWKPCVYFELLCQSVLTKPAEPGKCYCHCSVLVCSSLDQMFFPAHARAIT